MMSVERTLSGLETVKLRLEVDVEREEKALVEYKQENEKPFEHEERLRMLLAQQTMLNAQLDLDKGDKQTATLADNDNEEGQKINVSNIFHADRPDVDGEVQFPKYQQPCF